MPTPDQLITLIENKGVGFALILGVGYVLYLLVRGAEKIANDFYDLFHKAVNNHMTHFESSLTKLVENSDDANKKLDAQSQMLGVIIENTNKKTDL